MDSPVYPKLFLELYGSKYSYILDRYSHIDYLSDRLGVCSIFLDVNVGELSLCWLLPGSLIRAEIPPGVQDNRNTHRKRSILLRYRNLKPYGKIGEYGFLVGQNRRSNQCISKSLDKALIDGREHPGKIINIDELTSLLNINKDMIPHAILDDNLIKFGKSIEEITDESHNKRLRRAPDCELSGDAATEDGPVVIFSTPISIIDTQKIKAMVIIDGNYFYRTFLKYDAVGVFYSSHCLSMIKEMFYEFVDRGADFYYVDGINNIADMGSVLRAKTLEAAGFKVILGSLGTKEVTCKKCGSRTVRGQIGVDVLFTITVMRDIDKYDKIVAVCGDGDFEPLFRYIIYEKAKQALIIASDKASRLLDFVPSANLDILIMKYLKLVKDQI